MEHSQPAGLTALTPLAHLRMEWVKCKKITSSHPVTVELPQQVRYPHYRRRVVVSVGLSIQSSALAYSFAFFTFFTHFYIAYGLGSRLLRIEC